MATREASAVWTGGLKDGSGRMKLGSGACECAYSFGTRFEGEPGSNPEELLGAAHAGCFSMALAGALGKSGFKPTEIRTTARVTIEKQGEGFAVTHIELATEASIPNIDDAEFLKHAMAAKDNCPVSRALASVKIDLKAKLLR